DRPRAPEVTPHRPRSMAWPGKKQDSASERERALAAEIAALEKKIAKLQATPAPKFRSTALPHTAGHTSTSTAAPAPQPAGEPVFEEVDQTRLTSQTDTIAPPEHFNELGVRKYDLAGLIRRWRQNLTGATTSNPRLVNYLAAGSVQGLRAMR